MWYEIYHACFANVGDPSNNVLPAWASHANAGKAEWASNKVSFLCAVCVWFLILSKAGEGQVERVFPAWPEVPDRQADPSGLLLCRNLFNFEPGVGLEHGYPGHENHPGWSRPGRPKKATGGRIAEGARH